MQLIKTLLLKLQIPMKIKLQMIIKEGLRKSLGVPCSQTGISSSQQ